jgi:hypothetical protein
MESTAAESSRNWRKIQCGASPKKRNRSEIPAMKEGLDDEGSVTATTDDVNDGVSPWKYWILAGFDSHTEGRSRTICRSTFFKAEPKWRPGEPPAGMGFLESAKASTISRSAEEIEQ